MKRTLIRLFAAFLLLAIVPNPAAAQSRALQKALKKEYKARKKELKKEGWAVYGSDRSIDVTLLEYYDNLNAKGDDVQRVMGTAKSANKRVLRNEALADACERYSTMAGATVEGKVADDMSNLDDAQKTAFTHFYAAYIANVKNEIKGEMQEGYSVVRSEKGQVNGSRGDIYELQSFFVIDKDAASRARIRACQNALAETEAAQEFARKISEFVKEDVDDAAE